ncbi:MAG: ATP cone domain-containing protein [Candidatus Bathyarchaeota archaeon]|nr:ATP cone domain-containing protein [Candidatus Bathyarchaeum sp.]
MLIYVSEDQHLCGGAVIFLANNHAINMQVTTMTVFVTKYDGTKQAFDRKKILRTCVRMGATQEAAELIADQIESRLYDGISTKKILQLVFRYLKKHKPVVKYQIDLRRALSLMNSTPDFERFIQLLLSEHGYKVSPSQIIRGRCGEHEVDAVATKDGKTCFVEVKHHYKYHTPTNLDVSRIARAVFEDVTEGYELGTNNLKIDYAMIVCNTKLSEHAKRYADCRGITHIGWSSPKNHDLQTMIEEKKLYPITLLKGLSADTKNKLTSKDIFLLKQLTQKTTPELKHQTHIPQEKLQSILGNARAILSGN